MDVRVKGHRLHPGPLAYTERRRQITTPGMAICQCGAHSADILPSRHDRIAWHRQHLADVIAGKTRLL